MSFLERNLNKQIIDSVFCKSKKNIHLVSGQNDFIKKLEVKNIEYSSDEALYIYNLIKKNMKLYSYNSLINFFLKLKLFNAIEYIHNEIESRKIDIDIITYNLLIKCYYESEKTDKVRLIESKIRDKSLIFSNVTYTSLLKAYCMNCDFEKVIKIYKEIKTKAVILNSISYGSLINSFGVIKDLNQIKLLNHELKEKFRDISLENYCSLIKAYSNCKDFKNVKRTFKEMTSKNIKFDKIAYELFIKIYGESKIRLYSEGKVLNEIELIRKDMKENNIEINHTTDKIILDCYCNLKFKRHSLDQYEYMKRKYKRIGIYSYCSLIKLFGSIRENSEINKMYKHIASIGCINKLYKSENFINVYETNKYFISKYLIENEKLFLDNEFFTFKYKGNYINNIEVYRRIIDYLNKYQFNYLEDKINGEIQIVNPHDV